MRLTRRKDGPIKRSKRDGRSDRRHRRRPSKRAHTFVQRGGALDDIIFPLAKLNFLLSIYDDKPSIKAMLARLKKVLEVGKTINEKTVAELEAANAMFVVWNKVEVDWKSGGVIDVAKQTAGLENIKRVLLGNTISKEDDLAGGKMILHEDMNNTSGFEPNINNVAKAANDLFQTLLRGPTATTKRIEFIESFGNQLWQCVDATIDDIHAFILDEGSAILPSKPVLDNFSKIIKKIVKEICEKKQYFKLEKVYFTGLLQRDTALMEYFDKYRKNEAEGVKIQEKVVIANLTDIINKDQTVDDNIRNLFNHSIGLSTISTVDIGTTTFVVGCVDETKPDSDEVFVEKVKGNDQNLDWWEVLRSPNILIKLNQVYSDTLITYRDKTTSKCRVKNVNIGLRTITCDDDAEKTLDSIISVRFSNPNPAEGGVPAVAPIGGDAPANEGGGGAAPANAAANEAPPNEAPPNEAPPNEGGGAAPVNVAEGAEVAPEEAAPPE